MTTITTTTGSDNLDSFEAIDVRTGALFPLTTVTRVDVLVCSERAALSGGAQRISSADVPPNVAFGGAVISVRFGALDLYPGTYTPQILAFDADNPDGVVLDADIVLRAVC